MFFNTRSIKLGFIIAQVFLTLCLASCGNEPDNTVVMNGYKHRLTAYDVPYFIRYMSSGLFDPETTKKFSANLEGIAQPASFNVINTYSREKNGETLFVYKCTMGYINKDPAKQFDEGTISPILTFAMVKRGKEWFVVDAPN